ncbi:MAG: nucleotidyl transferase AbiEii/AbiGii toxin family protein [Phycisphaerales bacterium]
MNLARAGGRSFNDLLQLYAMERFLYRLSQSSHSQKFVLKGALLLRVWSPETYRTTRDIDLLGHLANDVDTVAGVVRAVCRQEVDSDGLEFDAETVHGEAIVEDGDYQGVRVTFRGHLGTARASMQIDVGFGDTVTPSPSEIDYPVLLNNPAPRLTAYPPETAIAEKFEVMLKRGVGNSRMKDFHDIWWLAQSREFEGRVLAAAVKATCTRRGTPIVEHPTALTRTFAEDPSKAAQWRAFRGRLAPTNCPEEFGAVVEVVRAFMLPVAAALASARELTMRWQPPGPWK